MLGFVGDVGDLAKLAMVADGEREIPAATLPSATSSPTASGASSYSRTSTRWTYTPSLIERCTNSTL
jgi:hypothetical protein